MISGYEVVFYSMFTIMMLLTIYKAYNTMRWFSLYDTTAAWIITIVFFIAWGVGFVATIINYSDILVVTLFRFSSLFIPLHIVFIVIETIMGLVANTQLTRERYNGKKNKWLN